MPWILYTIFGVMTSIGHPELFISCACTTTSKTSTPFVNQSMVKSRHNVFQAIFFFLQNTRNLLLTIFVFNSRCLLLNDVKSESKVTNRSVWYVLMSFMNRTLRLRRNLFFYLLLDSPHVGLIGLLRMPCVNSPSMFTEDAFEESHFESEILYCWADKSEQINPFF